MIKEFNAKSVNKFHFSKKHFRKAYPLNTDDNVFLKNNKKIKITCELEHSQINVIEPPISCTTDQIFDKIRLKIN